MARKPYQTILLVLAIALVWVLFGCTPPCDAIGIHRVAAGLPPEGEWAAVEHSRYCSQTIYYSRDEGETWSHEPLSPTLTVDWSAIDQQVQTCSAGCQFVDLNNQSIQYRLRPGYLERTLDGGETWQEELSLPDWQGFERVYLGEVFPQFGAADAGERGPFHAVTEPTTGRLIVAMGYEGVMVRDEAGEWKWVKIGKYQPVRVSRMAMLTYISPADWFRGILIGLFLTLTGLRRLGWRGSSVLYWIGQLAVAAILSAPLVLGIFAGGLTFNLVNFANQLLFLTPGVVFIVLLGGILVSLVIEGGSFLVRNEQRPVGAVLGLMVGGMLAYWLGPVLWSQGVLMDKGVAYLVGLAGAGLVWLVIVLLIQKAALFDKTDTSEVLS